MNEPISVTYTFVDGAHFFTSDEPEWAGLCAASTDLEMAWKDVSIQLTALAKVNHGTSTKFVPAETFGEFLRKMIEAINAELTRREGLTKAHKVIARKRLTPKRMLWQSMAQAA